MLNAQFNNVKFHTLEIVEYVGLLRCDPTTHFEHSCFRYCRLHWHEDPLNVAELFMYLLCVRMALDAISCE